MSAFTLACGTDVSHYSLVSLLTDFEQAVKVRCDFPADRKVTNAGAGNALTPEYLHVVDLFCAKERLLKYKLTALGVSTRGKTTWSKYTFAVWDYYRTPSAVLSLELAALRAKLVHKAAK